MIPEVNRQRIEKYLNAHGVRIEEKALMSLTRKLVDKHPEDAREILKTLILHHKGIDIPPTDEPEKLENTNQKYYINPKSTVEAKVKLYTVPRVGTCGVTTTRYVTKREYIIDNIIGFSVSGFLAFCIIGGIIKWLFF